jgi:hypothetical protein
VLYLIIYYSKYFKGNFFVNYSIQGLGEVLSLFYVDALDKKYGSAKSILYFLILMTICLAITQIAMTETVSEAILTSLLPFMILLIRLQVTAL